MSRVLVVLLAIAGCGKDGEEPEPAEPLTFVTFNAGLAEGFVMGTESRTPLAAEAIAALEADVVCLQEVWTPEQVGAVDGAAAAAFEHRIFPDAEQSSDASCDPGTLDSLVSCIETSCDSTCADEVVDCVFAACPLQFVGLPPDCMRCAMANVGEDPATVQSTCESAPVEYAYGGSYGIGLLSKHPISSSEVHTFASTSNRRGAIHAVIDSPGGPIDVFCTHLTAVFDGIPYPRDSGNWADEQLVQVDELNAWTDEVGGAHNVLLGDLNTGPGLDGIRAEAPEGFGRFQDAGWDMPYIDLDGRCTFCNDNPLIAGPDDDDNRLIDHVMLKGFTGVPTATRVVDGTVSAESCAVDLSTSAVSDHYGVSVTVAP